MSKPTAQVRRLMERDECLLHILSMCDSFKYLVQPQITAKVTLASLLLDQRVSAEVGYEIGDIITTGQLMAYDYILIQHRKARQLKLEIEQAAAQEKIDKWNQLAKEAEDTPIGKLKQTTPIRFKPRRKGL